MGWLSVEQLQSLSKLHAYYVSNTKTELKFAAQNMNDDDIYNAMQNIFFDEVELDEIVRFAEIWLPASENNLSLGTE
ncbi:13094_t:CDS:2, partial [Entrophospora sp. SA101]